ncbi:MAG: GTP-binding protein [Promethearchaeota archaeon]|jgi:small GTP-binding protein
MNGEGFTSKQLTTLKEFLKRLDYKKKDLVHLERPDLENIKSFFETLEEDWINTSKKSWEQLIRFIISQIGEISNGSIVGLDWLISKIAWDLYTKFEKTISQGQAEAVIRRVLDIKLSSTGRTQIYDLRKKLRRYEKLLSYFRDWAEKEDFLLKVVILGLNPEQAPKLLQRYTNPLPETKGTRSTLGVEFYSKPIDVSDTRVKLQLWDISMEEQHRTLLQHYCHGTSGAILFYNKGDRKSFELVKESYSELKKATNLKFELKERKGTYVDMPIILVGLTDGKVVSAEEGQSLVKELGLFGYIEILETETENFEKLLSSLSRGIIKNSQNALKKPTRKFRFKITVVGDGKVGKTSLIKKFTKGVFQKDYVKTIGAQFCFHEKHINGDKIRSLFWDIAGQDSFHFLRSSFFRNSRAAIIVYSLEENELGRESLNHIEAWYNEITQFKEITHVFVFGNKIDLMDEERLDNSKIEEIIKKMKISGYYKTSAKTGKGVDEAFNDIINELTQTYKSLTPEEIKRLRSQ